MGSLCFRIGQSSDDGLRTLCEQQQMELEYLRNMMVWKLNFFGKRFCYSLIGLSTAAILLSYSTVSLSLHLLGILNLCRVENGIEKLNLNTNDEQVTLNARISELQEKLNAFDKQ